MSKIDVKHCQGCRDDFYNGNNPYGIQECWRREGAELRATILVPINMEPPYTSLTVKKRPKCYSAEGYVCISPDALTKDGFWK